MAITKETAEAPCPLFAGRGVDLRGFTIKMPYKTYLTCEPSNISSERSLLTVFNYDMAEYVYNKAADAYAFGVYVETGGYTDAITAGKHMYAAKFFLKLSEAYSLGAGQRHNCDVRGIAVGLEVAYDLSGVAHGAYISVQFKEDADGVTIGGYYLANTQTYGVIGLEIRTEAKDNADGGITVGAAAYGCVGLFVAQKNDAAWTGNYAAIVLHIPYEGSDAIVGTTYGIRFDDAGIWTGTDFDVGIDLGDQTVIGIDIGAVTTGITFTGTVGTVAITSSNNITCPKLISFGSSQATALAWNTTNEFVGIFAASSTATLGTKTCFKFSLSAIAGGATTSGRLECFRGEVNTADGQNLGSASIRGVVAQININGACTSTGLTIGMIACVYSSGALTATSGEVYCLGLYWGLYEGSDCQAGSAAFIDCYKFGIGEAPESIIHINNADPSRQISYFFDLHGVALNSYGQFCSDTAIDTDGKDSDGRMAVRVGETTYYIPLYAS